MATAPGSFDDDVYEVQVRGEYGQVYYPRCIVRVEAIFTQAVGEDRFTGWTCVPREATWNRNNPREADTSRITLDYRDFPLDPRMLSAAHVQIYAADTGNDRDPVPLTPANLRFQGFVDVPESTLSNDVAQVVFDCRDYTALYLNRSWRRVATEEGVTDLGNGVVSFTGKKRKSRIKIPRNVTLGAFIEQIREKIRPPGSDAIESPPTVFDRPEVASGIVAKRVGRTDLTMRSSDTAWDVLTMVCEWFGQVPVWDLDPEIGPVLRIRTPAADGRNIAHLGYGRNITRLQFRRNLQAPEQKAIRIIIWNPRTGEAIEGLYPKAGDAAGEFQRDPPEKSKGSNNSETLGEGAKRVSRNRVSERKRIQYILEGDFSQEEATDIAKIMYDEQAQGRIMGSIETVDMIGSQSSNLLDLANGDRLVVNLGSSTFTGISHLSDAAAAAYLSDPVRPNSFPPEIAQVIVEAYRAVEELDIEFFVLEANHSWSHEDGYKVEITFTDFLFDKVEAALS